MAILTAVHVSITHNVVFVVIDGYMAINLAVLVDSVVDAVLISTEDYGLIAVFGDVLVNVFEIIANEEPNSSVGATDECHDWWFV